MCRHFKIRYSSIPLPVHQLRAVLLDLVNLPRPLYIGPLHVRTWVMGKLVYGNHLAYYYSTLIYLAPSMCLLMANLLLCWVISLHQMDIFFYCSLSFLVACSSKLFSFTLWMSEVCVKSSTKHAFRNANIIWWTFKDILFKSLLKCLPCHDRSQSICSVPCCRAWCQNKIDHATSLHRLLQWFPVTLRTECQACYYKR